MRHQVILSLLLLVSLGLNAQTPQEEISAKIELSGSNYLAYPTPRKQLTPAPEGYQPCYISHYGRHGSRYFTSKNDYNYPVATLLKADSAKALTKLGRDVLRRALLMQEEALNRYGDLTELGAEQHKQIAKRMFERFPQVFEGDAHIDAKSTLVIRCILSMENELQQFLIMNPALQITHDASYHDMYYMNLSDQALTSKRSPKESEEALDQFKKKHRHYDRLIKSLFCDKAYVEKEVDQKELGKQLFYLAGGIQNSEIRHRLTLYDIFTPEELYENWRVKNVEWYLRYGASPYNGGTQPFTQRNLLRRIIHETDSCLAHEKPGATLRFGHETMVLPLTCLLGLNGYDMEVKDLEKLEEKGWVNYRIFPMGANIQFIFYRRHAGDKDVLVKVLLNEEETTLPLSSDKAPYYCWSDVRQYYLHKLDSYRP